MSALVSPAPPHAAQALTRSELTSLVSDLSSDPASWRPLLQRLPDRRWWTRLVANDLVDVWLISWPVNQSVDLHDHGYSSAALTVVEGTLEHVLASRSGELSSESLLPGTLLTVEPRAVHDVRNASRRPAVSIHAYSPPLSAMTYYQHGPAGLTPLRTLQGNEPEIEIPW